MRLWENLGICRNSIMWKVLLYAKIRNDFWNNFEKTLLGGKDELGTKLSTLE